MIDIEEIKKNNTRFLCFITAWILVGISTYIVFFVRINAKHYPIEILGWLVGLSWITFEEEIWSWIEEKDRTLNAFAYPGPELTKLTFEQWRELSIDQRLLIWERIWKDADN